MINTTIWFFNHLLLVFLMSNFDVRRYKVHILVNRMAPV